MSRLWFLYCRGVLYVSLQAGLVSVIAAFNLPLAFVVGGLVSFVWTGNVQAQHGLGMSERIVYSLGAGSGTVLGMVVGRWVA